MALIKDVRTLVERHRNDSPASAVTGCAVFKTVQPSAVKVCTKVLRNKIDFLIIGVRLTGNLIDLYLLQ